MREESEKRGKEQKQIAIPVSGDVLAAHFGHCEQFMLFKVDMEKQSVISMERLVPPRHEPGVLPAWLHEKGADVIIAGGMGMRAQQLFEQNSIEVVVGAQSLPPEAIVQQFMQGSLESGANLCDH